jgi:RimJ/RimL family protein N-acetyltransferase
MVGDVNLFINDPHDPSAAEIDVMIAEAWARGRGVGRQAVLLMLHYGVTR